MIPINELRIGNIISVIPKHSSIFTPRITKIDMIWPNGINENIINEDDGSSYSMAQYDEEEMHPILLTKEILEKCGLVLISNPNYTDSFIAKNGKFKLVVSNDYTYISLRDYCAEFIGVKSLHHLQNIYFFITGEELNINI